METINVNGNLESSHSMNGVEHNDQQNITQTYYLKPINEDLIDDQAQKDTLEENRELENVIEEEGTNNSVNTSDKREHYYRTEIEYFQNKMDITTSLSEITFKPPPIQNLSDHSLTKHSRPVTQVAWNVDGSLFASCSQDKSIILWEQDNLSDMKLFKELKESKENSNLISFDCFRWHPMNPFQLATLSEDNNLRIWNVQSSEYVKKVKMPIDAIDMEWSPNGKTIAIASRDGKMVFINVEQSTIEKINTLNINITKIAWNNNGLYFLIATKGSIVFLKYPALVETYALEASRAPVTHFNMDPYGRYLAVGSLDGRISIWNLETMMCKRTWFFYNFKVCALSFSHCGSVLACGSPTGTLKLVDVISLQELTMRQYRGACRSAAWHPKKYILGFAEMEVDKDSSGELKNRNAHILHVLGA